MLLLDATNHLADKIIEKISDHVTGSKVTVSYGDTSDSYDTQYDALT
jgi:hypothetical protein